MGARMGFAVIGILVGFCILVVFGVNYQNWNVALWGLVSGLGALYTLLVHIGFRKQWWWDCPESLRNHMLAGCFLQLAGVVGFVAYLVLGISQKQGLVIYGNGYYLTTVWCFMTWKWGFQLFFFSRDYWRRLTGFYQPLFEDSEKPVKPIQYGTS
nr:hypothetical protein BaRGS_013196 [Batillaria attramentaria]